MTTLKELIIKGEIREGFREGTSKLVDRPCYGYIKSDNGKLIIHEAEAKTVRWIFERYLAGDSLGKIADGLAAQGILSPTGLWPVKNYEKYKARCLSNQRAFTILLRIIISPDFLAS